MSVTLSSMSGVFKEDSVNLMASDNRSKYGWRSQISVWWIGAAAVCLGFLLLFVILGVVAHNSRTIGHQDSKCLTLIYSLTIDRNTLRDERDQLKINSSNLTKEMEVLQSQYNAMAVSRDNLQEEIHRLNLSRTDKPCYQGWKSFRDKCYYFSPTGVTKTWESSRKDCKERRADLVIITTTEELDFVSRTYEITWIGLSDKEQENKWKWVDGTNLLSDEFWQKGEPNNNNNEDCAEVSRTAKKFNDVPCARTFSWVCED
ncbi:CD209 antigen-like protein C [Anoplopoma fimbria]|uniref:C-type lectin domain family 4 member E n=1 Tax=Anoplopoma fimbria TaxID=229290 RepID=C3KIA1_ANOFI|nr:CD209 antigen-like protein C [Anoplopoma fimbria]ACQ58373.1 C-type lectin domain family 4 member E [Anoplopoma fimbria]